MPQTPIYGFPFEDRNDQPGISLTGGAAGTSPILAEEVEKVIVDLAANVGQVPTVQLFESSSVWNKPAGLVWVRVRLVGGGGSGGGAQTTDGATTSQGGGGGGGGYSERIIGAGELSGSEPVTIGAGGAGAAAGGTGNAGGTTSFGTGPFLQATGGGGGETGISGSAGTRVNRGQGGGGSGGDLNFQGSDGGTAIFQDTGVLKQGDGGGSFFAGQATTFVLFTDGAQPNGYGGGSSGASNGFNASARGSNAGANGVVIVEEFYS